jgi:FkbM family methyltransferase
MEEALKHLQRLNFNPSVIVDVGAANGTFPLLKVYPRSRYLWIEPLVEFQEDLKQLAAKYKGDYILAAAAKSTGSIKLNVHPDLGGSSTHREADGLEADGIEREVKLIKLDDLIDQYGLNRDVLLKVDVQGAELEVLAGAPQLMHHCEVIILEVSFFKFLKTNPEFFDAVSYMKSKGFVAYDIFDGHNRPLDHALAQKDILFVKEDGFSRKSHNWATLDQRRALGRQQVQR